VNDIIQSLWIGRPLSLIEQLSITSFLQNGHQYHLYCYGEIRHVPAGTTLCEAAEILPASEIFCYRHGAGKGSVAAFANLFRYKLLFERGGWWTDTDMVCLRPFDVAEPVVFASERGATATTASNAVIRLPPGHDVARSCYRAARQEDRSKMTWGKTGPHLIDRIVRETGLQHFVKAPDVFCPLDYWRWKTLLEKNPNSSAPLFTGKSHAIHLWHEQWRRAGVKMNPATGEFQSMNFFQGLWRRMRRKPTLTFDDTTPLAGLLHKYLGPRFTAHGQVNGIGQPIPAKSRLI
jgi:hypothetical protein